MKQMIVRLMFFMVVAMLSAQEDCAYKINVDLENEQFRLTNEKLVEYELGQGNSVFIYFSLMKQDKMNSLVAQISLNAIEMPPIMCFDSKSRISFKLEDGSFVSLPYLDEVNCGRQTDYEDQLDNSTSEAAFFMDTESIMRLRSSELVSMRITSMNTHFDMDFKSVISNATIPQPIYPKEFFTQNLKCLD